MFIPIPPIASETKFKLIQDVGGGASKSFIYRVTSSFYASPTGVRSIECSCIWPCAACSVWRSAKVSAKVAPMALAFSCWVRQREYLVTHFVNLPLSVSVPFGRQYLFIHAFIHLLINLFIYSYLFIYLIVYSISFYFI